MAEGEPRKMGGKEGQKVRGGQKLAWRRAWEGEKVRDG